MAKSQETFSKKEKEKKRHKKRQEKEQKKEDRKAGNEGKKSFEDMLAYVDENGQISATPPDPLKKIVIKAEDIDIGVPKHEDEPIQQGERQGVISFFNEAKGYGFIKDINSQESIFVHMTGLVDAVRDNDKVTFEVEMGQKGLNAVAVKLIKK